MHTKSALLKMALSTALLLLITQNMMGRDIVLQPQGKLNELHAAIEAIRTERAQNGNVSPARILVDDGNFPFDTPLILGPSDSHITIEAKSGAHPTFSGGKTISGWNIDTRGTWTTHIDPEWKFETLWVNGRRGVRARTPNKGFFQGTAQPTTPVDNLQVTGDPNKTLITINPNNASALGFLTPEEQQDVQALVYHSWDVSRLRIAGVNASEGKIQFTGGGRDFFSSEAPPRLRFENYMGALDEPGEWFLEKNGTLHYIPLPGETPENSVITAPLAMQWIILKGDIDKGKPVENVSFKGLKFEYQHWSTPKSGIHAGQIENGLPLPAIEANGARNLSFQNCIFEHTSTHAMWLKNGCSNSQIVHCLFQDLGAGGVYVGDPGVSKDGPKHTHHVKVENSIFRGGGRHFPAGIGVSLFHASDCEIRHCDIGDFYYSAISIGWTWGYKPTVAGRNLVEYCHLHHLGWGELSDMGAVYTLGQQLGTVICNNHIHAIACASYGGWGMYNDEGSTGVLWENNLVHDTQTAGYHQHYGRGNIVRNNILAWGNEEHVRRSKPEDMLAFAFERNIVLMGEGKLLMQNDKNWHDGRVFMADNVYWHSKGAPSDFAGKSWADWQAAGNDVRSVLADPLFRDPANGDWTLSKDSPALKLGFIPFDWTVAGVEGEASWKAIAAQSLPPMIYGQKAKREPLKVQEHFEIYSSGEQVSIGRKNKNRPPLFAMAEIPGATGKCLEFRDSPDQAQAFEPHFYFNPNHTEGTTHVSFDLRLEPSYRFLHEWRDSSSPYKTSVYLLIENGAIHVGGKKIAEFPPLTWVHFEIDSPVGKETDGAWTLKVTPSGGPTQTFNKLPSQKGCGIELQWLGFISPGTAVSKAWLDNLQIENQ